MRIPGLRCKEYPALLLNVLLVLCFALPALAAQRNVKTGFGAVGDGVADDRTPINNAIAALLSGDELFFPCGTYKITSALSRINVSNVIIDGQTGCSGGAVVIQATGSGYNMMTIGSQNVSAATALTASSAELSTTFQANLSSIGVVAGDYVFIKEGDQLYGGTNYDGDGMTCSVSGCRSEVLKIASVNGSTATVTTALHYFYDTSMASANDPIIRKLVNPVKGINMHDLILDGGGNGVGPFGVNQGLVVSNAVDLTVTNVTIRNISTTAISGRYGFNQSWTNITMTHCAGNQGSCIDMRRWGHMTINGMSITQLNDIDHTFGFSPYEGADGTFTNVTVDKNKLSTGSYRTGRAWKYNATSYTTVTGSIVRNVPVTQPCCSAGGGAGNGDNGISLEYYSSHNTFNNCTVTNNGGNGVAGWGENDQFNSFNNCTMSGNGIYQVAIHSNDHNWTFGGGTYTGRSGANTISVWSTSERINNVHVRDVLFNGSGSSGLQIYGDGACVENNRFSGFSIDIVLNGSNNLANGNTTPDGTNPSPLDSGQCSDGSGGPAPPTQLSATVS